MQTYAILRRSGWKTPEELKAAGEKSGRIGNEEMPDEVRWIRSYALAEDGGDLGTICIYEAVSPEALREHASRVPMPADEIIPIAETIVVREDPQQSLN